MDFIIVLLIILVSAACGGELSARLGQTTILGKIIAGIIVGPAVLGWVSPTETIHNMSEIGILFLMFIAGLETDATDLYKNRKSSIAVALGGLLFPVAGGFATGLLFGLKPIPSVFLGLLLAATSVSISILTLRELGQLNSRESTTILGAALVDDITVMFILAITMGVWTGTKVNIGILLGKEILFFLLIALLGWKAIPWFMKISTSFKATENIISAVIICFVFASLAHLLGVSSIIGAFAAGLAVSRTDSQKEIKRKIVPIAYTIFIPVFFVQIGLSVSFVGIQNHIWFIIIGSLFAILTKWFGAFLGAKLTSFSTKSAIRIGAAMMSRGEVALILLTIGLEKKLIDPAYASSILIIVMITTLITPVLLKTFYKTP
ncbi:cation:proton antiporter [Shimazuella sp. AN120528]|uniref:cation:proton antiporter n=1 Tax=Shimazuella soli TaxID=1892854 RepID=UPI001F0D5641|nr:cation:proton antiporter [Shimazuella soli]MCH5583709.1 cation:proton antiporter [Shimazuella soli]